MKLARDTWLIYQRQMTLVVRTPLRLVIGFVQPLAYMLLFAPLLKSALNTGSYAEAYRIYVPGLLIVLVLFSGFFVGFSLIAELRAGIIERSRVTPVSRFALLLGRALSEVTTMMVQAVVITLLAIPFGLTVGILPLLLAYLVLFLMGLLASSASYAMALQIRNVAALGPLINTVSQPLALLSGVLLPMAFAPVWLVNVAKVNPFYWATEGVRQLFDGQIGNATVGFSFLISILGAGLCVVWATRMFAERVR